ncbi:MAG: hypothetical protein QOI61_96 [Actinomycetota bacterium]|jgi:hypothetical protein
MVSALVALTIFGFPGTARAALSISAAPTANLGSTATGSSSKSAQLGTVTVNASGLVAPSFVATVTTTVFTTGAGTANETIQKSSISYWSGPATTATGTLSVTPGQANAGAAQSLLIPRTAFSAVGLLLSITVAWNPTLIVNIPTSAVAGTYTGTITHSVA